MYTILGSGFGIYGYMPCLVGRKNVQVVLPRDYREVVESRPELNFALELIEWVPDSYTALSLAHSAIIAKRPQDQVNLVHDCLEFPNIKRLILEKPLSTDPDSAAKLVGDLVTRNIDVLVAYTFPFLQWQSTLKWPTQRDGMLRIRWDFMAHHFAHKFSNWKRRHSEGGGVLRFFGIHLIAMLSVRGYTSAKTTLLTGESANEPDRWHALFEGNDLMPCIVMVNSRSEDSCFNIEVEQDRCLIKLEEPYASEVPPANLDRRVPVLGRIINEFDAEKRSKMTTDQLNKINDLWLDAEMLWQS